MSVDARIVRAPAMPAGTPKVCVAIVGAGACGLVAALALADAGIEAVVLERDARPQGSTGLSSGFIPAAGTTAQRAAGVADSPAAFAQDITAKAHGTAAPHLVRAYTEAIPVALDALQQRHGLDWQLLDGFLYPGHRARRMHALPQRTGAALMAALQGAATAAGVSLLTQARVVELHVDGDGRIVGVGCERPDGLLEHLGCNQLLLACNGFGGNPRLVSELLPEMRDAIYAGHAGNDGSALLWGRALGARLADLGAYQGHGSWVVLQGALMSWAVMMQGGVQVNRLGRRFHDETQGYSEAAVSVLAQPDGIAWNVFDAPLLALARGFPDFCQAEAAGALRQADDADALATLIGCAVEPLRRTLGEIDPAAPDRFGRRFGRALAPPYLAVKVGGALFHTQGGLAIDAQARVLRENGTPMPNLLAAGGAARGVSGNAVWGYLSGNGLLSAVAGGWIAAMNCARRLQERHDPTVAAPAPGRAGDPARARRVRCAVRAAGQASRLRGLVRVRRFDRLHPAGRFGRRADHFQRGAGHRDARRRSHPRPLIVDADTAFGNGDGNGNGLNVQRTVRGLERAGAAMIRLEHLKRPPGVAPSSRKRGLPQHPGRFNSLSANDVPLTASGIQVRARMNCTTLAVHLKRTHSAATGTALRRFKCDSLALHARSSSAPSR